MHVVHTFKHRCEGASLLPGASLVLCSLHRAERGRGAGPRSGGTVADAVHDGVGASCTHNWKKRRVSPYCKRNPPPRAPIFWGACRLGTTARWCCYSTAQMRSCWSACAAGGRPAGARTTTRTPSASGCRWGRGKRIRHVDAAVMYCGCAKGSGAGAVQGVPVLIAGACVQRLGPTNWTRWLVHCEQEEACRAP